MSESSANKDRTDWSHVHETINMLYVAVCQIEATLADSNESVETLTNSFTRLAQHTNDVSNQMQHLTKVEELESFKKDLADTAAEMNSNISSSIQAFQFYDRVCQRLDHVARSLEKVSSVMSDEHKIHQIEAWQQIQHTIKNSYTMEAERIMFEFIMRGGSIKEALQIYRHQFENSSYPGDHTNDEIELF